MLHVRLVRLSNVSNTTDKQSGFVLWYTVHFDLLYFADWNQIILFHFIHVHYNIITTLSQSVLNIELLVGRII